MITSLVATTNHKQGLLEAVLCSQMLLAELLLIVTSSPFLSLLLAAIDHRITSLEQTLLQACTKNHSGLDTHTHRNPLHPDTTTRARKKTSVSDTSLHLSLDASHDVSSESDGEGTR